MADSVYISVYPREGTTYPDASGTPVTAAGATVDTSKYIRDAIRAGFLLTWDPYGVYLPEDRTTTPGSGDGDTLRANSFAALSALIGTSSGQVCELLGYYTPGDGGGGTFYWSAGNSSPQNYGTVAGSSGSGRWVRLFSGAVNVKWFGAVGDGSEVLVSDSYSCNDGEFSYTAQTQDGRAINRALRALRTAGGGHLFFPEGEYVTLHYLEQIDFPARISGAGMGLSTVRNSASSPANVGGHGIFLSRSNSDYIDVSIEDITLDGYGSSRSSVAERANYPMAFYGRVRGNLERVRSRNSPIDCLLVYTENSSAVSFRASGCVLEDSFRNTLTLAGGWNQRFTDCLITGGGQVQGGTLPGYCLDIEPDIPANHMENIRFVNCTFRKAKTNIAGGVWSQASFDSCTFIAGEGTADFGQPYNGIWSGGEFTFNGCRFIDPTLIGSFRAYDKTPVGFYVNTQFVELNGCTFEGCGIFSYGPDTRIKSCTVLNSAFPVLLGGTDINKVVVSDLSLVNVVDAHNFGDGTFGAAFAVSSLFEGTLDIANVTVRFDPFRFPAGGADYLKLKTAHGFASGVYIQPTLGATAEATISNVHVSGYYRKYPAAFGLTPNDSAYRDWWTNGTAGTAPADTSGLITTPGAIYYRNCSMYGDSL